MLDWNMSTLQPTSKSLIRTSSSPCSTTQKETPHRAWRTAAILLVLLLVSVTGCAGGGSGEAGDVATPEPAPTIGDTATPEPTPTIDSTATPTMIPAPFMGHTGILVDVASMPDGVPFYIDGIETSVIVEGVNEALIEVQMPDGTHTTLPGVCASLFPSLHIAGDWVEEGVRLHATAFTVTDFAPEVGQLLPPQTDVVAYVVIYPPDPDGLYPPAVEGRDSYSQIAALLPDGSRIPLLTESLGRYFTPFDAYALPPGTDAIYLRSVGSMNFDCPADWFVRYLPESGVDGAWLVEFDPNWNYPRFQWDSRANRGIIELDDGTTDITEYWWLASGDRTIVGGEPDGTVSGIWFSELRPGTNEGVGSVRYSETVRRFDMTTAAVLAEYATEEGLYTSAVGFDPTGRSMLIRSILIEPMEGDVPRFERSHIKRYDLESGTVETLWTPDMGALYHPVPDANGTSWYGTRFMPGVGTSLYLLGDGAPRPFYTVPADRTAAYLLACHSGGAIYVTGAATHAEVGRRDFGTNPYFLTRVDAEGTVIYADIPLPDWGGPITCP